MYQLIIVIIVCMLFTCSKPSTVSTTATTEPVQIQPVAQIEKPKVYDKDGCNIDVDSHLVAEHDVGQITNLEEERFEFGLNNECTAHYDIAVDGQMHHVDQTETGLEQMNSICYYARENGRKNLLLNLPGKFNSHANIECRYKDTIGKSEG